MTTTAISIQDLRKSYNGSPVLKGLNLDVRSGEFVSIVGQSGCGKSTLLNCIAGFLPYEGRIQAPKRIGFVFQSHALYPFMTCGKNIALGLGHLAPPLREKKVAEYLEIVGLPGYANKYPWELSGGESQRVAMARAFAPEPDAVLMDEPLSALDVMRRESMLGWLMAFLRDRKTTILMVTHWIDEAILPADRVVVIAGGTTKSSFVVNLPRLRNEETRTLHDFVSLRRELRNCISES